MKLRIGIPAYRNLVHVMAVKTVSDLVWRALKVDWEVSYSFVNSPILDRARNTIMREALDAGMDWLLSIDSDNHALGDQLIRMLATADAFKAKDKLAAIAAPCQHRGGGWNFTMSGGKQVKGWSQKGAVFPVEMIGFGIIAFNLNWVREHFPARGPWFQSVQMEEGQMLGEDFAWCRTVAEKGGLVYVDTRVQTGHEL